MHYVARGDLITAAFYNDLVDALNALQAEVDALGPSGRIQLRIAPGTPAAAGGVYSFGLTLDGKDLAGAEDFTLSATYVGATRAAWDAAPLVVRLAANPASAPLTAVRVSPGAPPVRLAVSIAVPAGAQSVDLAMHAHSATSPASNGSSMAIRVAVAAAGPGPGPGQIALTAPAAPAGAAILPGTHPTVGLTLDGRALGQPVSFTLRPVFTDAAGGAVNDEWSATAAIVDASGLPLTMPILVAPGVERHIGVAFDVPGAGGSVHLSVVATPTEPGVAGATSPKTLISVAPLQTAVVTDLVLGSHEGIIRNTTFSSGQAQGAGVEVLFGETAVINLVATVAAPGPVWVDVEVIDDEFSSWAIGNFDSEMSLTAGTIPILVEATLASSAVNEPISTRNLHVTIRALVAGTPGPLLRELTFPIGGFS